MLKFSLEDIGGEFKYRKNVNENSRPDILSDYTHAAQKREMEMSGTFRTSDSARKLPESYT